MRLRTFEILSKRFDTTVITPLIIMPGIFLKLAAPWDVITAGAPYAISSAIGERKDWRANYEEIANFRTDGGHTYGFTLPAESIVFFQSFWSRRAYGSLGFRIYSTNQQPIEYGTPLERRQGHIRRKLRPVFYTHPNNVSTAQFYKEIIP